MPRYIRRPDQVAALPVGTSILVHGKHSSFQHTKTAGGWVDGRVSGRLGGESAGSLFTAQLEVLGGTRARPVRTAQPKARTDREIVEMLERFGAFGRRCAQIL
jgi:hypothetical protein